MNDFVYWKIISRWAEEGKIHSFVLQWLLVCLYSNSSLSVSPFLYYPVSLSPFLFLGLSLFFFFIVMCFLLFVSLYLCSFLFLYQSIFVFLLYQSLYRVFFTGLSSYPFFDPSPSVCFSFLLACLLVLFISLSVYPLY